MTNFLPTGSSISGPGYGIAMMADMSADYAPTYGVRLHIAGLAPVTVPTPASDDDLTSSYTRGRELGYRFCNAWAAWQACQLRARWTR